MILAATDRVCEQARLSPKEGQMVRYIVSETLAGKADALTAKTVGSAIFNREIRLDDPVDADPLGVVRVTMTAIRKKLTRYYDATGRFDPILIDIPTPGYVPAFKHRSFFEPLTDEAETHIRNAQAALDNLTLPSFKEALACLDKALAVHPGHPRVLALMADVHAHRARHGLPPRKELEQAERLVARSLAQSQDFWEAHLVDGAVKGDLHWDWEGAKSAFQRAIALKGDDAEQHAWHVVYLMSQGRGHEAVRLMKAFVARAGYRMPLARGDLGILQILTGDLDEAEQTLRSAIALHRHHYTAYVYLAVMYEARGDLAAAYAALDELPIKPYEVGYCLGFRGFLDGLSGRRYKAELELKALQAVRMTGLVYVPPHQIALVLIGLGRLHEAVDCLRQSVDDGDPLATWLPLYPFLRHLHHLPEFWELVERIGLAGLRKQRAGV